MHVSRLQLSLFRNYRSLDLVPGEGLNILVGDNAQGKSNVLEALYLSATTRSTRAAKDSELVRFGGTVGSVAVEISRLKNIDTRVEMFFSTLEKKQAKVGGVRQSRMTEVIGQINAVLFDYGDLEVVRGEPSVRRRFLDFAIAQSDSRYAHSLGAFKKALAQRNSLLKAIRENRVDFVVGRDTLSAWTEQLVNHGASLTVKRRDFVRRLAQLSADVHHELSQGVDKLDVTYQPSVAIGADSDVQSVKCLLLAAFVRVEREEMARGSTVIGPQRDDVRFMVNDAESRLYGSQGQQRSVVLSLKLAERKLLEELVEEPPLLLLDDVLSDLDDHRRQHLFDLVSHSGSQTFVTCTEVRSFPPDLLASATLWNVADGVVTRISEGAA